MGWHRTILLDTFPKCGVRDIPCFKNMEYLAREEKMSNCLGMNTNGNFSFLKKRCSPK